MHKNSLNLDGYSTLTVIEDTTGYNITIKPVSCHTEACIYCGSEHLIGHGRAIHKIRDLPVKNQPVWLHVQVRRLRCGSCRKTFKEPLPLIDVRREMTERLAQWTAQRSLVHTFAEVAEQIGSDEKTVRNVFRDHIDELEQQCRFETPDFMALGVLHLIHPRCVVGNIANNTVIEILPECDEKRIEQFLNRLARKETVQCVIMDMLEPCRDAVSIVLPNARIVVDKFYVTRMADAAVEKVRKKLRSVLKLKQKRLLVNDRVILAKRELELTFQERQMMQRWANEFPILAQAYAYKEAFYAVYDAPNAATALQRYAEWQIAISLDLRWAFIEIIFAFSSWQKCILAYFDQPCVGAYAEHLYRLITVLDRLKRGYSFDALRARLLFNRSSHLFYPAVVTNEDNGQGHFAAKNSANVFLSQPEKPYLKVAETPSKYHTSKNLGAEISALVRLIEEDAL